MGFVRNLAKGGLFGLGGLAATGAFKGKKKDDQPKSLVSSQTTQTDPSLVNKSIY